MIGTLKSCKESRCFLKRTSNLHADVLWANTDPSALVRSHRDLKPGNLLLTKDLTRLKIADFGMCKIVNKGCSAAGVGNTGTEAYMAPEVFHKVGLPLRLRVAANLVGVSLTCASDGNRIRRSTRKRWTSTAHP